MRSCSVGLCVIIFASVATLGAPDPAAALSLKECSAKYRAAQSSGTLGGMSWQQFRQANCAKPALALSPGTVFPKPSRQNTRRKARERPAYTRASISTGLTEHPTATAVCAGSQRAAATTANATSVSSSSFIERASIVLAAEGLTGAAVPAVDAVAASVSKGKPTFVSGLVPISLRPGVQDNPAALTYWSYPS